MIQDCSTATKSRMWVKRGKSTDAESADSCFWHATQNENLQMYGFDRNTKSYDKFEKNVCWLLGLVVNYFTVLSVQWFIMFLV